MYFNIKEVVSINNCFYKVQMKLKIYKTNSLVDLYAFRFVTFNYDYFLIYASFPASKNCLKESTLRSYAFGETSSSPFPSSIT